MAGRRLYPRAGLKKNVRAQTERSISKSTDVMVFLDYVLFMEDLVNEAAMQAQRDGTTKITTEGVKKSTLTSLKRFKA